MTITLPEIREELPALEHIAYLNTGTAGPMPRRTAEAVTAEVQRQLRHGRSDLTYYEETYTPTREEVRARFARLLGAEPDEVAITHHTTDGMNVATWGLNWQPGDEIVTTTTEHPGGLLPVYAAVRRFGLTVRMVDVEDGGDEVAGRIAAALSPRTRLVTLSHVSFKTGAVLPIAEIVEAAHDAGALVAVDGAQSAGAIPLDVRALGVDFYAIPGQKWLCGPEGVGALYVRRDRIPELAPTFVGYASMRDGDAVDLSGHFIPASGARRYEVATVFWPGLFGMHASLRWLEETLEYEWIYAQTQRVTRHCRTMLSELPGVTIWSPRPCAGLTTFTVEGVDPDTAVAALLEQNVVIRAVSDPLRLRVSTGFFNDEEDVERLCTGIASLTNV